MDPTRINQGIAGFRDGNRVMTDAEVARLLNGPLVIPRAYGWSHPDGLSELIVDLDERNHAADGLPMQKSYLISEGAHIRLVPM